MAELELELLGFDDVAERMTAAGSPIAKESVRMYYHRTLRRQRAGQKVRPGDFPLPDYHVNDRTPVWLGQTIDAWLAARPGRGAGGGGGAHKKRRKGKAK
jgi:hypothetical protein